MTNAQASEKASIYQLSMRVFAPEGTLRAATKMLPFLAKLGPQYIQLTPVATADDDRELSGWSERQKRSMTGNPHNNYRIKDYFGIDPEYGTADDLHELIRTAHRLGLRVLLDLVYFHCGPNNVFLAEHPEFVKRNPDGTPFTGEWHFPVIDFDSPATREYLWENMVYFIQVYDVDGYRCDVGDYVPLDFWREGIRRCRALKPDVFMLNEGRNPDYLNVFDANYFYDGCFDTVPTAKGEMTAREFRDKWEACRGKLPEGGRMLHFIDNHDVCSDSGEDRHERVIGTRGVEACLAVNFLLDGVPFVFNGYEVCDELKHSMFANRFYGRDATVNWANALTEKGERRFRLMQKLFAMKREEPALASTEIQWLENDRQDAVLSFIRPDGKSPLLVIVNLHNDPLTVHVKAVPFCPGENLLEENARASFGENGMTLQMLDYGYWVARL